MKLIRSLMVSAVIAGAMFAVPGFAEQATSKTALQKPVAEQVAQSPSTALVNINQADAGTLADRLNGIGLKKAQAIVSYREQHGPFKSVDELANVTGIGEATVEKNKSIISVN
jgi:competence protein ComEA